MCVADRRAICGSQALALLRPNSPFAMAAPGKPRLGIRVRSSEGIPSKTRQHQQKHEYRRVERESETQCSSGCSARVAFPEQQAAEDKEDCRTAGTAACQVRGIAAAQVRCTDSARTACSRVFCRIDWRSCACEVPCGESATVDVRGSEEESVTDPACQCSQRGTRPGAHPTAVPGQAPRLPPVTEAARRRDDSKRYGEQRDEEPCRAHAAKHPPLLGRHSRWPSVRG